MVIIRKSIVALTKAGHIHQVHDGQWLFKALLAVKPHQEMSRTLRVFLEMLRELYSFKPGHMSNRLSHSPLLLRCQSCIWHSTLLLAV
jgi:hypothetical protein